MKRSFKKPDIHKNEENFVLLQKSWHPDEIQGLFFTYFDSPFQLNVLKNRTTFT